MIRLLILPARSTCPKESPSTKSLFLPGKGETRARNVESAVPHLQGILVVLYVVARDCSDLTGGDEALSGGVAA